VIDLEINKLICWLTNNNYICTCIRVTI
jgi:hypothetical protein